jgi:UDP-2,3-diacylglucosamine pyrophosphatase LpxH
MIRPTRIFVISDLHLGGDAPAMMSFPQVLAEFITSVPTRIRPDEAIELVIAGDVIDFLAIELGGKVDAWTVDPQRAVAKLEKAIARDKPVYDALATHLAAGHGLTILIGNHDLELALPAVQAALCKHLKCRPGAIHFVDDGRAWRFGRAHVEHGNRYDDANLNDWTSLREIASSQSRGETPLSQLQPSFGSQLVRDVVAKHKPTFEFLDTLQPQGVLVAYLMATLDPSLISSLPDLLKVWRGQRKEAGNPVGAAPKDKAHRGEPATRRDEPTAQHPVQLLAEVDLGSELDLAKLDAMFDKHPPPEPDGSKPVTRSGKPVTRSGKPVTTRSGKPVTRSNEPLKVVRELLRPTDESLINYFSRDERVPQWRLRHVQTTLLEMTWGDNSLESNGPVGTWGHAAERIRRHTDAQVVVMGHTHQAREVREKGLAIYINTGTWADLVRIPTEVLAANEAGWAALEAWLKNLYLDRKVRELRPTWAEIRVEPDGEVTSAELKQDAPRRAT